MFVLVVRHGLPQPIEAVPPDERTTLNADREVLMIGWQAPQELLRTLVDEPDHVRRIAFALSHGSEEDLLGKLVHDALAVQPTEAEREALATVLHLLLQQHDLTPEAWSQLVAGTRRVLSAGGSIDRAAVGHDVEAWCEARDWLAANEHTVLERAVLNALGGAPLVATGVTVLMERLRGWTELLGVRMPPPDGPSIRVLADDATSSRPVEVQDPPRVKVLREVPLLQDGWVLFDLSETIDDEDPADPRRRSGPLTPTELAELDARWSRLGLSGGTRVVPLRIAPLVEPVICLDLDLILNVLLRLRGDLLRFGESLRDARGTSTSAAIVPDQRLHAHVIASGRYRFERRRQ